MRIPAGILVSLFLLATMVTAGGPAALAEKAALSATPSGISVTRPGATAVVGVADTTGRNKAELRLTQDAVRARVFRNDSMAADFSGSRLAVGRTVRSPYLARLGTGNGISSRVTAGGHAVAGAVHSGRGGDSVAGQVSIFDGTASVQAGRRDTGRPVGSTSFGGGHVDFDVLNAEVSLRWHAGREQAAHGSRSTSAGGVAIGMPSVMEDGDHLRAAMSRPMRPEFELDAPVFDFAYTTPMWFGRMTYSGGVDTGPSREASVRLSWGLTW